MRISPLAVAFILHASLAGADGGIDFAAMPKGCSWKIKFSSGEVQTQTFLGKVDGKYRVGTVDAITGAALNDTDYNARGQMIRRSWADGRWERYEPFGCFSVLGKCTFTFRNSAGERIKIDSEATATADGFISIESPRDGAPYPAKRFILGPYGLATSIKTADFTARIIGFTACGIGA